MQKITKIPVPGNKGIDVIVLQQALNRKTGAGLKADGDFGIKTKAAVAAFQKSVGLAGDGVPGRETIARLDILMDPEQVEQKPVPVVEEHPEVLPEEFARPNRDHVARKMLAVIQADVDAKLRETKGKNRSPRIDSFNKRAKAPMGSPYCASGAWCALDDACKKLKLKNPAKPTASSQDFRRPTYVPAKYIRKEGELGQAGDFGVLQVNGDSAHGHLTVVRKNQTKQPVFETSEYNTDASGSRDGDGCYNTSRSTKDGDKMNSGKLFICFTDVCQWVIDHNA